MNSQSSTTGPASLVAIVMAGALAALSLAGSLVVAGPAVAEPEFTGNGATPAAARAHIVSKSSNSGRDRLEVWSAAMGRNITVEVQHPNSDAPRPTLYMLDGAEAHEDESGWYAMTNLQSLASVEKLNVVTPVGDPHSYYTDWRAVDPGIGRKFMYETFLTRELPPLIDSTYNGNGRNAIAGASMGGVAALTLVARRPSLYSGVAGYSDCANVSSLPNQLMTRWDVARGGGNVDNMWGPFNDREWAAHDPYLLAANLRGKTIYMSSGNGVPGKYNNLLADPLDETLAGMMGEAGSSFCTRQMSSRLSQLGIPYTTNLRPTGTHKWGYWRDELNVSWPILMRSLGLR